MYYIDSHCPSWLGVDLLTCPFLLFINEVSQIWLFVAAGPAAQDVKLM